MAAHLKVFYSVSKTCLLMVVFVSCVDDTQRTQCSPGRIEQKLVNGTASGTFLAVSTERSRAIGRVWPVDASPGMFCTGVLVSNRWVLTARHCGRTEDFIFELGNSQGDEQSLFSSVEVWANEEQDAMLIELEREVPTVPIGVMQQDIDTTWLGVPVQLAGYGSTEEGRPSEELLYLVEPIVEIKKDEIVVDGSGRSGACIGDSGGPILVRDTNGRLVVAGVLSTGSTTCRDFDVYVRADLLRDWVDFHIGTGPLPEEKCGDVTEVGFCRRGVAIWCGGEEVTAETCNSEQVCGWSIESSGYRCLNPEEDLCEGVDDVGVCEDGLARRCKMGTIVESDCEECGLDCALDSAQGRMICLPEDDRDGGA